MAGALPEDGFYVVDRTVKQLHLLWANQPLRIKGLVVIAFPLAVLFVALASYYFVEREASAAENYVRLTLEIQYDIQQMNKLLYEAATGVRGYMLTGRENFLEPYRRARAELPLTVERLDRTIRDPEQREHLAQLKPLVSRKLAELAELQSFAGRGRGPLTEPQILALVESKAVLDALRRGLDDMQARQDRLLEERTALANVARARNLSVTAAAAALGLLGSVAAVLLFSTGIVRRAQLLEANAHRLERGEALVPLPPEADEIGHLARALETASTLLAERERALREARAFLEHLIASGPVLIFRYRLRDFRCTYVSPNIERLLGYASQEVLEADNFFGPERVHPDERAPFPTRLHELAAGEQVRLLYRFRHRDGGYRWLQGVVRLDRDESGEPNMVLGYAVDVSERKAVEDALRESEERFRLVVEGVRDYGIFALDPQGRVVSWNAGAQRIKGYAAEEIIGQHFSRFYPAETRDTKPDEGLAAARAEGRAEDEGWRLRKDGSRFWANVVVTALRDERGNLRGFSKITRDMTERKRVEEELRQAREEAERASQAKSEFLSRMSHELRTPLHAILGFAQLLDMDSISVDQRANVEQILKAGRHLLGLINEILDIARIEAGRLDLALEPVPVDEVLREAHDLTKPLAQTRGITLQLPPAGPERHCVRADRQRLTQVLLNLLSNAVKYNSPNGTVTVLCQDAGDDRLRLTVADNGVGIESEMLRRLFTPFERLGAGDSVVEGTGLGLALSKRLIEAMGGTIGVESSPGLGSVFWIELPRAAATPASTAQDAAPAASEEIPVNGGHTVLYIEDNLSNLALVQNLIQRRPGVRLLVAMQGRLGLALADQHRPDLILLDANLPDMHGLEVLRQLRETAAGRATPVIMISADATPGAAQRSLAASARAYLTKPLDIRRFLDTLDATLARHESVTPQ